MMASASHAPAAAMTRPTSCVRHVAAAQERVAVLSRALPTQLLPETRVLVTLNRDASTPHVQQAALR